MPTILPMLCFCAWFDTWLTGSSNIAGTCDPAEQGISKIHRQKAMFDTKGDQNRFAMCTDQAREPAMCKG
jgi:hypothetical protein